MNITADQIQLLKLLSLIIAMMAGMLSITEHFKKNGLLQSILAIALCILPFLFLQQILIYTDTFQSIITPLAAVTALLILIVHIIKKDYGMLDTEIKIVLFTLLISRILLFFYPFISANQVETTNFINVLGKQRININLYLYLAQRIFTTIGVFCNFVQACLTTYFFVQILAWLSSRDDPYHSYYLNTIKVFFASAFSLIFASGLHWKILECVASLF